MMFPTFIIFESSEVGFNGSYTGTDAFTETAFPIKSSFASIRSIPPAPATRTGLVAAAAADPLAAASSDALIAALRAGVTSGNFTPSAGTHASV